jgi:hypothetical protein
MNTGEWILLAQDSVKWWNVVKTVLDFQVPKKCGQIFVTN